MRLSTKMKTADMEDESHGEHRFGFVAIIGRPNVGKSTLANRMIGRDLCIVTAKAQTTRNRITALLNLPQAQIALLDTPGIHEAKDLLNRSMVAVAMRTLQEVDVILHVVTPSKIIHAEDVTIVNMLRSSPAPSVLVIDKSDKLGGTLPQALIQAWKDVHDYHCVQAVSGLFGTGVDELIDRLVSLMPPGPPMFPEDDMSDLPVRFFSAEIIREQIIRMTGEEVPHKSAVVVESFKEGLEGVAIQADIHTERESQKKILVGRGGRMIKNIGTAARKKLEDFLECRVRLDLFVKVSPRWTQDPRKLREFGYLSQDLSTLP